MKRMLLIVFLLLLSVIPVSGQTLDVSTLSYDELNELRQQIDFEYRSRQKDNYFVLEVGDYIGGKEIPVGSYYLLKGDRGTGKSALLLSDYSFFKTLENGEYGERAVYIKDGIGISVQYGPVILSVNPVTYEEIFQ